MTNQFNFLVKDEAAVMVLVMIQGETMVVVINTQVVVEDLDNMITMVRKITHLHTARRSKENQNRNKLWHATLQLVSLIYLISYLRQKILHR